MLDNELEQTELEKFENKETWQELIYNRPVVSGITIDGQTSMDLDDGIALLRKGDNYILQVSIADVSSVVNLDSNLFYRSLERAETIYYRDSNDPMLPRILSEDKLSLMPKQLRPAITFEMEILPDGNTANFNMKETAFLSNRKFNYSEFDKIESKKFIDTYFENFKDMSQLATFLLDIRRNKGALAIYDLVKGIYTNEEGEIMPLQKEFAHLSNLVIQEFMILTNQTVACFFAENDLPFLYRNHVVNLNAPSRSEILSQINTAILNPKYLEALRGRSKFWFGRANYSPYLRGHYGLNLPAYSHVTSPIRRVADLINHILIKSYINKTEIPFNFNKLIEISEGINKVILQNKENRSNYYKEEAYFTSIKNLEESNNTDLVKMKTSVFEPVLNAAASNDTISESLSEALKIRFDLNYIDTSILFCILFNTPKNSSDWMVFKKEALRYICITKGTAVSMLNILLQKEILNKYDIEIKNFEPGYKARIVAMFDGIQMDSDVFSYSANKKEASHYSACKLLHKLLDIPLSDELKIIDTPIESSESENINIEENIIQNSPDLINEKLKDDVEDFTITKNNIIEKGISFSEIVRFNNDELINTFFQNQSEKNSDSSIIEENYIGQLLELCNKHKNWSFPVYDFTVKGMQHSQKFICKCKLVTPKKIIEEFAQASTKKIAKHEVSKKMVNRINEIPFEAQTENLDELFSITKNSVGIIMEICQKFKIDEPLYDYKHTGSQHRPNFECTLSINWKQHQYQFNGIGETKKIAKQNAASNCLTELKFK